MTILKRLSALACAGLLATHTMAAPITATATIQASGSLDYDQQGIDSITLFDDAMVATEYNFDAIFGDDDYFWSGTINLDSFTVDPNFPMFAQPAMWELNASGFYEYGVSFDPQGGTGGGDGGAIDPIPLGFGAASDIFVASITDYNQILPALITALGTSTPNLGTAFGAINSLVNVDLMTLVAGFIATDDLALLMQYAPSFVFSQVNANTVIVSSTFGGLALDSGDPQVGLIDVADGSLAFGGEVALQATYNVSSPGIAILMGLGLSFLLLRRRRA